MPHLVLHNTMGAAFIGVVAAAELHGVACLQAWYYFIHQHDSWPLKLLVSAVMISDTIHQILISHSLYTYVITNYDNPAHLLVLVWSLLVEVVFNGITALLVKGFLTMRVWRLSNRNVGLTSIVVLLVISEFGCVVAYVALSLQLHTFTDLKKLTVQFTSPAPYSLLINFEQYLSDIVNVLAAAGDILIAGILCILLHRSRTGFRRSETMINILIAFTVNTGVFTSLCAIASLISSTVAGNTFLYITFYFCIGRLYTNSLLATLNARKMILNAGESSYNTSDKFGLSLRDLHTNLTTVSTHPPDISIKISTTKEFTTESDHGRDGKKEESDLHRQSLVGRFKEEV